MLLETALIAVGALAAVTVVLLRRRRPSFRRMVTDPRRMAASAAYHQSLNDLALPPELNDEMLTGWTEELLSPEDRRHCQRLLTLAGDRALSALLRAIADPRFHVGKLGDGWDAPSPFERVAALLEPLAPPEAVPHLAAEIASPDDTLRKTAALTLGSFGLAICVEPLRTSLAHEDDYTRSYALMGIMRSLESDRAEPAFRTAVFEAVLPLLDRDDRTVIGSAPQCLIAIDPERALPILTSERFLQPSNGQLYPILKALNEASLPIPAERLLAILDALRPIPTDYPQDRVYGEALLALAATRHERCEQLLGEALESDNEHVSASAAGAVAKLRGVDDPFTVVLETHERDGYEALTWPQKVYWSVHYMDAEVKNGGFAQYLYNPSGDNAGDIVKALEDLGAEASAAILRQVLGVFGPAGPSADRDTRITQLRRLPRKVDALFSSLQSAYYKDPDRLAVQFGMYVARNADHFKHGVEQS